MKYFLALFLLISVPAFAEYYVINIDNEVIAKCKYQPDIKDLESRNEIAIFSEKDIPLNEVEYRGNKLKKHVKTKGEIQAEEKIKKIQAEEKLITERMRKIAREQLESEGILE